MSHHKQRHLRRVVDSNMLQSPRLREYLSKSKTNFAVLTDYAAMEAYKGDTLVSIFRSMSILSEFPSQVIVLKTTGVVCGLSGRPAGLQRRMIDTKQTHGFQIYCQRLRAAQAGDKYLCQQLLELGREADAQMQRMIADVVVMPEAVKLFTEAFTESELKVIRNNLPYPGGLVRKVLENIVGLAQQFYQKHPRPAALRNVTELPNTFLFRTALCAFVWVLDRIAVGGSDQPAKLRNDIVDLNFATFATYFDGLLSADRKPLRIYDHASFILGAITRPAY